MATAAHQNATHRFVVLLRPSEKQCVSDLAREENVSSSEIVRRCIQAYESSSNKEQDDLKLLLSEMNRSLDTALEKVKADRLEIADNLSQMRNRRPEHA